MEDMICGVNNCCSKSIEHSFHSRRCFLTGEYCAKQTSIQTERERLFRKGEVNALVIVNHSDLSDVLYRWKLHSFIESLKKYLFISDDNQEIACVAEPWSREGLPQGKDWHSVKKIHVLSESSNATSNYVICNRICQQIQIADLIIVDVSVENPNIFYEFGLAMAFGKLILPLCYKESYYTRKMPETSPNDPAWKNAQQHIGCYPWCQQLFEYYGIRYREEHSTTAYCEFHTATDKKYGFRDQDYTVNPYCEELEEGTGKTVGEIIYNLLKDTYNSTLIHAAANEDFQDGKDPYNTVVIYTMDGFLNENQAGQCIINFYRNMTMQMQLTPCFSGDRVGVLGRDQYFGNENQAGLYSVDDVIRIGMNQATYMAQRAKIKPDDYLKIENIPITMDQQSRSDALAEMSPDACKALKDWDNNALREVKFHVANRCIPIYSDKPIRTNLLRNGLQRGILDRTEDGTGSFDSDHFFCLFHVMLRLLKYTSEIVVDISHISLQDVFWLGAAHGSDVAAIKVRCEQVDGGRKMTDARWIFDVADLWAATLWMHDTDCSYRELEMIQMGIEQQTKLMNNNMDSYESQIRDLLFGLGHDMGKNIALLQKEKKAAERTRLESFYRDRFWRYMMRGQGLMIYLTSVAVAEKRGDPMLFTGKWSVDAAGILSHYLTSRRIHGNYQIMASEPNLLQVDVRNRNFIVIGDAASLLQKTDREQNPDVQENENEAVFLKGFRHLIGVKPDHNRGREPLMSRGFISLGEVQKIYEPTQLAQLILWRSVPSGTGESINFRASLVGTSGSAMMALASILVEDDQKRQILHTKSEEGACGMLPLNSIQKKVREAFLDRFYAQLEADLAFLSKEERRRLRCVSGMYLSTQLYQYFFPFLTKNDEASIYIGLESCLTSMGAAENDDFSWINRSVGGMPIVQAVVAVLRKQLAAFCGIEVLYRVDTRSETIGHDIVEKQEIRELDHPELHAVICLFA